MKSFVAKGSAKGLQMWSQRVAGVSIGIYIYFWKSKGLSDKNTTAPKTSDYSFNLQLSYIGNKARVEFKGNCLKQDKITYTYENSKHLHCL